MLKNLTEYAVEEEFKPYAHSDQLSHKRYLDICKTDFNNLVMNPIKYNKEPDDYDKIKTLGSGAFAAVFLVRDKSSFEPYAMKAVEKEEVIKKNTIKQIFLERKILQSCNFPFVLNLIATCKDYGYIYFILPFEGGGELFTLIRKAGALSELLTQFYAAQMVLALEYLHHCCVIHRDVKPENIFINQSGYIKLGDFGFCKIIKNRTWTLCGTPEYIAPEVILSKGYSYAVDWWALGILIFEMCAGFPPFFNNDPMKLYEKILDGHFKCPENMMGYCKNLVKHLLEVDPSKRFGSLKAGVFDIKSHAWFQNINWLTVLQQKMKPPFVPESKNLGEAEYFPEISEMKLVKYTQNLYVEEFENF